MAYIIIAAIYDLIVYTTSVACRNLFWNVAKIRRRLNNNTNTAVYMNSAEAKTLYYYTGDCIFIRTLVNNIRTASLVNLFNIITVLPEFARIKINLPTYRFPFCFSWIFYTIKLTILWFTTSNKHSGRSFQWYNNHEKLLMIRLRMLKCRRINPKYRIDKDVFTSNIIY